MCWHDFNSQCSAAVSTLVGCWHQHLLLACLGSGFWVLGSFFWVLAIWLSGLAIWLSGVWLSGYLMSSLHRVWGLGIRGGLVRIIKGESRIPTGCPPSTKFWGFCFMGSGRFYKGHCAPTLHVDPPQGSGGFYM